MAKTPMMAPETIPTIGPTINIITRGCVASGIEALIAASRGWFAMYVVTAPTWAAVTQTLLTIPTASPCRKTRRGACRAIRYAQITKITSQKTGSTVGGISEIVPTAIASPNSERAKISDQRIQTSIPAGTGIRTRGRRIMPKGRP